MPLKLNKKAYKRLIDEDLLWLFKQPPTLERDHIEDVLKWSVSAAYPQQAVTPDAFCESDFEYNKEHGWHCPECGWKSGRR